MKAVWFVVLALIVAAGASLGATSAELIHGSHSKDSYAVDDTLTFSSGSRISSFCFGTDQDVDLIVFHTSGGAVTYSIDAGGSWCPEDLDVYQIIIDVTGATSYDLYW